MELGLKNYMEDIVAVKIPQVLTQLKACGCERCRLDITAYVLNKIPPKYVVTRKGTMYAKLALLQSQFEVDVVAQIAQAIAIVKANPRHDDVED